MTTPTTETNDAPADTALTVDEAADAIFAKQTTPPPSPDDDARRNSDAGQGDGDEEATEAEEQAEEEAQPEVVEAGDDHVVRIGDQTVKVADLKRLAAQESELTQASAQVAQRRLEADQRFETSGMALEKLIERAKAAFKPFETIDWVIAQKELSADELRALRAEAKAREDDVKFLTGEADQLREVATKERHEALVQAAAEAHKVLPDVMKAAGGTWDQKTHEAITDYAVKAGFPAEAVSSWVDPNIIAMVYKAMRYDAIRSKTPAPKPAPVVAPAKPAVKATGRDAEGERPTNTKATEALARLKQTGSVEDAADAIFARMTARR